MPIEAELPDGTVLEFPDGTADEIVQGRVRSYLGVGGQVEAAAPTPQTPDAIGDPYTRSGGPEARIGARPGFAQRAFNKLRNTGRDLSTLADVLPTSIATNALRGEPIEEKVVEALRQWMRLGTGLANTNPAEILTAPAGDIGDLVGLERPPGSEMRDPADAAVNLALMPLLRGARGGGVRLAPSMAENVGARGASAVLNRGAQLMRNRSAARSFDVMRPTANRAATAEDIALEVADGTPSLEGHVSGVGVGTRRQLAQRARARQALAAQEQEMLQNIDTPIDVAPASARLRARAQRNVTTPPDRTELAEVDTGLVDPAGDAIMGIESRRVEGVPMSQDPALVGALRGEADFLDELAAQYPDGKVPAGELFKQRSTAGARLAKAYEGLPGDVPTAAKQAGKAFKANLSAELRTQLPDVPVAQVDRAYRVWRNAAVNFERSRLTALTSRGWSGLRDLMVGRLAGVMLGASADLGMGGYGVAGALTGAVAGESALWQSMRATSYAKLARLLNAGETAQAAQLLNSTLGKGLAAERGVDAVSRAERNRRARRALNNQAEGVTTP